ncbi:MAG TPA: TRAM domain-containing protein [bacterium]|nr:TRAM domain-containing protein [bacterium]
MGKEYDVTIDGTGSRGDGIAHIEGLVIFVPGATKGQSVRVKITGIGARAAKAEIVR